MDLQREAGRGESGNLLGRVKRYRAFYLMLLPLLMAYILFHYLPMYGIRIAFFEYGVFGIKWFIGLENFQRLFASPYFWGAFRNTLLISGSNLLLGMIFALGLALLLNELTAGFLRRCVQTVAYLPHFLSWIVVASIFTMLLSPQGGAVNAVIKILGGRPVYFLAEARWWRYILLMLYRWKETGWGAIVYLAALSSIELDLYEAAWIDGASRIRQVWHVTLPAIRSTILIVLVLQLSSIMGIFESVLALQNPLVIGVSDVIGTFTYRVGLVQFDFDYATAVGLFNSIISLFLVLLANKFSKMIQGESIL